MKLNDRYYMYRCNHKFDYCKQDLTQGLNQSRFLFLLLSLIYFMFFSRERVMSRLPEIGLFDLT